MIPLIWFYVSHQIFINMSNVIYMLGIFHIFFHFVSIILSDSLAKQLVLHFCFATDLATFSSAFWFALFYCLLLPLSWLPQNDFFSTTFILCFRKMWCKLKTSPHILLSILKFHMCFCESSRTKSIILVCG